MHVTFTKNSEELDQKYLMSNLTTFTPEGLNIQLNFSDPLLVSQGEYADFIKIKLLKSFFLQPSQILAYEKGLVSAPTRTLKAGYEDDGEYLIVT